MSRTRSIATLLLGLGLMAAAGWFVTAAFPLVAEPQLVVDGPGISVELSGAQLLHRPAVRYPAEAQAKGVQGTVAVQVRLGADGTVVDASIVSGPDELRKAVLESVLSWHFSKDSAGGTRTLTVSFQLPASGAAAPAPAATARLSPELRADVANKTAAAEALAQNGVDARWIEASILAGTDVRGLFKQAPWMVPSKVAGIEVRGLSEQARAALLAILPLHVGDTFSVEAMEKAMEAVRKFDAHVRVSVFAVTPGEVTVFISGPDASSGGTVVGELGSVPRSSGEAPATPRRVQVGGNVQASMLIDGPKPAYPPLAKAARISGAVHLHVFISKEGNVQTLTVIPPAHPLLAPAAIEAVRQWRYKPTLLNGQPVEVETTIDVNFVLPEEQKPQSEQ